MKKLILLCIIATSIPCWAIPHLINYQGYLTRPDETPLDTVVAITFTSDAAGGGNTLWFENHVAVQVADGLFNVTLGSVTALPDLFSANRWLGVTVGADAEMTPRAQLHSAAHAYRVGTVDGATGGAVSGNLQLTGKAAFGSGQANGGTGSFVCGQNNTSEQNYSFISGVENSCYGIASSISGGSDNNLVGDYSIIGNGMTNYMDGNFSGICSGEINGIEGNHSVIGGGEENYITGSHSAILSGWGNAAANDYTTVAGGYDNLATGSRSFVGAGGFNKARGNYSVVSGGGGAAASDSNSANGNYAVVGGGQSNAATALNASVVGGYGNSAVGPYCTVGGGSVNRAEVDYATVAGGYGHMARDFASTIAGGYDNLADSSYATVGGGYSQDAGGYASTIAGGYDNVGDTAYATRGGGRGMMHWRTQRPSQEDTTTPLTLLTQRSEEAIAASRKAMPLPLPADTTTSQASEPQRSAEDVTTKLPHNTASSEAEAAICRNSGILRAAVSLSSQVDEKTRRHLTLESWEAAIETPYQEDLQPSPEAPIMWPVSSAPPFAEVTPILPMDNMPPSEEDTPTTSGATTVLSPEGRLLVCGQQLHHG
ncbi:MAG: hypothetical protein IPG71_10580 [bacterium]|nr:hypothetical protein [bacterium]